MFQGISQRVRVPDRVSLFTVVLSLVLALGLMLLGIPGARATQIVAHGQLSLYGGPGETFSVLATVAAGAKVDILWCNAEASWCLVQNGAAEGWTPRDTLVKKGGSTDGAHAPSSVLASDNPLTGAGGASLAGTSPQPVSPGAASAGTGSAAGAAIGTGGASGSVSAGVSAGGAKLGVSAH